MTSLARNAYCDTPADPAALLDKRLTDRSSVEDHLLDRLISSVYADRPRPDRGRNRWTAEQAETWLRFLAVHLSRRGTRDIAWWRLHKACLSRPFRLFAGVIGGLAAWLACGIPIMALDGPTEGLVQLTFGLMFGAASGLTAHRRLGRLAGHIAYGLAGGLVGGLAYAIVDLRNDTPVIALVFGLVNGAMVGLTVGLTAGLTNDSEPSTMRLRLRIGLWRLVGPLIVGVAFGFVMGLVGSIAVGPVPGFLGGLGIGLMTGLMMAFREVIKVPTDVARSVSPSSVWAADRAVAIANGLLFGLVGGLTVGIVAEIVTGGAVGIRLGIVYGVIYALATAHFTAWYRFAVARAYLALQRRLPWPLMEFLADAHRRGVIRQVGAVYQFRHARLQDRLARRHFPS